MGYYIYDLLFFCFMIPPVLLDVLTLFSLYLNSLSISPTILPTELEFCFWLFLLALYIVFMNKSI